MDCSLLGSCPWDFSVIPRILEWVAISFSRGSSQPKDQTCIFWLAGRFFTTREVHLILEEEQAEISTEERPCEQVFSAYSKNKDTLLLNCRTIIKIRKLLEY